MRLSLKFLLWLWVFLFAVVGSLVYNAYSKLNPDTFMAVLTEQVQKNYPGTKLEIGNFDYRVSVDFNMSLQNITLKRNQNTIGTLKEIELRVPWWLLVFNRGKAQINLTDLDIFVDNFKQSEPLASATKSVNHQVKVSLPDYLTDAQYTLRAQNISVKDIEGKRRFFHVSKLLVREFQYGKNSAFEVKLPISIGHGDTNYISELWLFGDVTPGKTEWLLNFRGEFRTRNAEDKYQFEDVVLEGRTKFKPHRVDVQSNITLFVEKKEIGNGTFFVTEEDYQVNFNFSQLPFSFLNIFEKELKNPYLATLDGNSEGSLIFHKLFEDNVLKITGRLSHSGNFVLSPKDSLQGKWLFTFDDTRWNTSFMTPQGEVSYFRRSIVNLQSGGITQYTEELDFSGIDGLIAIQALKSLDAIQQSPEGQPFNSKITIKKSTWKEKPLDADFRYGASPDLKFYQANVTTDEKSFKLNYQNLGKKFKLNMDFQEFDWDEHFVFLAPYLTLKTGHLDGKVEAQWQEEWDKGQWLVNLTAKNLQEARGHFFKVSQYFWDKFTMDSTLTPEQAWSISLRNDKIKIESMMLEGVDPAKMNGQIDVELKSKSHLVLTYPKNKNWKPVRKELTEMFWKRNEQ